MKISVLEGQLLLVGRHMTTYWSDWKINNINYHRRHCVSVLISFYCTNKQWVLKKGLQLQQKCPIIQRQIFISHQQYWDLLQSNSSSSLCYYVAEKYSNKSGDPLSVVHLGLWPLQKQNSFKSLQQWELYAHLENLEGPKTVHQSLQLRKRGSVHIVCASCGWREGHGGSMDGERRNAYLTLDFLPRPLRVGGVLDVKQRVVDAGERLSGVFIMAAGSENHMPENRDGMSCYRIVDRFK